EVEALEHAELGREDDGRVRVRDREAEEIQVARRLYPFGAQRLVEPRDHRLVHVGVGAGGSGPAELVWGVGLHAAQRRLALDREIAVDAGVSLEHPTV